ncbi:MAG: pyruvate, water dikinase regulatory protein [Glycocaulis sp.]
MPTSQRAPDIKIYFHVHMISDSTGETLMSAMRASAAQFDRGQPIEHLFALVRSPRQMTRALEHVEAFPGVVMYTVVNQELREALETRCAELAIPAIALLDPIETTLSAYLGAPMTGRAGAQRTLDADYYRRIEAMNYCMAHDDGQGDDLASADVILLGISRTSKTPTSIYLGNRGVRAANIPLVPEAPLPPDLFSHKKPVIVGLYATPERIVQIRRNRLLNLNEDRSTEYVDEGAVKDELIFAKRLFARHNVPSIDVTRRSIEETAAKIINLLTEHRGKMTGGKL